MTLYKYVTADKFSRYLENYLDGELFFSGWHDFNDKKEGKYLWNSSRIDDQTAKQLKKDLEEEKEDLKEAKNSYTVCSTAETDSIFRLWELYADSHQGVCIGIEVQDNICGENHIRHEKISYQKTLKKYSELHGNVDEKALSILTCKLACWKQESEIRLIRDSKKKGMYKIGEPVSVTLGTKFVDVELFQRLVSRTSRSGIKIKQAVLPMSSQNMEGKMV
jgi:hypothetical protein